MARLKYKYTEQNIVDLYFRRLRFRSSPGVDHVARDRFERIFDSEKDIIVRKVLAGEYHFSPFKEQLVLKGRGKEPRVISLPTIRDKITLGLLKEILQEAFSGDFKDERTVHRIIYGLKDELQIGKFDYFIRMDIKKFYPSIDHDELLRRLRRRIRDEKTLALILSAIRTPTVSEGIKATIRNEKGIPEGLSISNVLADIYMLLLDDRLLSRKDIRYFRYVDDILILCDQSKSEEIKKDMKRIAKRLHLEIHDKEKMQEGILIDKPFDFLGYHVEKGKLSVKETSRKKLERSLEQIFLEYKQTHYLPNSHNMLRWKLNLRITGCIIDKKKYGWVFFFSQMDEISSLFALDWLVRKLIGRYGKRFGIDIPSVKRFVRTYHEITENLSGTSYIPNFSEYSLEQKRNLLSEIYDKKLEGLDEVEIDKTFNRVIFKSVRDLEKDLQALS